MGTEQVASMDPQRLQRLLGSMQQGGGAQASVDTPVMDTAETIYISSLALLKMLKHGRAGVPMEVMGLMVGEFVDDYMVVVTDVFAMPQSGTGVSLTARCGTQLLMAVVKVSVEAVDP